MEGDLAGLLDFICGARADDVGQIHRARASNGWDGLQLLDCFGRGVGVDFSFAEFAEIVRSQIRITEGSAIACLLLKGLIVFPCSPMDSAYIELFANATGTSEG